MKLFCSVIIFLSLAYFPSLVFSQITTGNGFIINGSGVKQPGKLEYVNTNLSSKRVFIPEGTGMVTVFTPAEIASFQIDQEVNFKSVAFKGKKVFMQVISEGQLNLYNYKDQLYVKTPADSLIKLTGGDKTVMKDGKKYAVVDYTYKSQLRAALKSNAFDSKLNSLQFKPEEISKLAREVNGQPLLITKPALENRHQFEARIGFNTNAVRLKNIAYAQDSLNDNLDFTRARPHSTFYLPGEKQNLRSIGLGLFYKRKIGSKYAYIKAGVVYNYAFEVQNTETQNFYRSMSFTHEGAYPTDLVGKAVDTYTYNFSTIDIPVSYYAELTDGRIRPFIDLGIVSKLYSPASVTLKREIYDTENLLRTETGKMSLPAITIGPILGLGCKYILTEGNAILAGIHTDATTSFELQPANNLHRSVNLNMFVSYGF